MDLLVYYLNKIFLILLLVIHSPLVNFIFKDLSSFAECSKSIKFEVNLVYEDIYMIYLIVLIAILIGIYKYDYRREQKGKLMVWIILCIVFICIAGFRYRMGGDTIQYMSYFRKAHKLGELRAYDFTSIRYAPGFVILTSLCKTITEEFMLLQFVVSTFINIVIFRFFWKNTRNIFFALLLYSILCYLNFNMEVIREAIAVSIFLLAWPLFRDGKWLAYYCVALCGLLFHASALFLLILPLINLPGINYAFTFGRRLWVFGILAIFISLSLNYLFIDFIRYIAFTESMMDRANAYSHSDLGGLRSLNIGGILSKTIRYVFYPAAAMLFINKRLGGNENLSAVLVKMERLTILSIYLSLLSVGVMIIQRFNNYVILFPIVLMSDWIFSLIPVGAKWVRLHLYAWALIFLPFIFISFYAYYFNSVNKEGTLKTYMIYYPYKDAINKEMDPDREKVIRFYR